jgi:hypothetical protein
LTNFNSFNATTGGSADGTNAYGVQGGIAENDLCSAGNNFVGQIVLSAFVGFSYGIPADGRLLPISQYTALFSVIGTTYGGDGRANFAVPDLRAITPSHMLYSICQYGIFPSRP